MLWNLWPGRETLYLPVQTRSLGCLNPTCTALHIDSFLLVQRHIKHGMRALNHPEYQIMYIEDGIAVGRELQELKVIRSTLISGRPPE